MVSRYVSALGTHAPDIITFSESPPESFSRAVAAGLGMKCVYFPSGENWPGTLMSRCEILGYRNCPVAAGERPPRLFTRHWGMAEIRLPGGEKILLHSAHLHPAESNEIRMLEIAEMLRTIGPQIAAGRSVLLQGDLNLLPDSPEYRAFLKAGFVDSFRKAGSGSGFTIPADAPYSQLDYIFAAGPLAKRIRRFRVLNEGPFAKDDDPASFSLSDHLPVMADFA